jgi:phosphatidylinositol kinase/protein kinase (PI-3  family)
MRREKFPERIPFRLTRMLIKAMEVSGIEGNYRTTCENTMRVLRASKDSLMAILEAFVFDPLVSFKLLAQNLQRNNKNEEEKANRRQSKEEGKIEAEQKKIDALKKIKNSIVDHVMSRYKENNNNFPESHFSRRHESYVLQSVINEKGGDIIKDEEDTLNETAAVVVERIDSKIAST